ncbi:TPA: restriction endonuclease subunit S [Bacillus cereus]|nr:restriction endonuclease subunit S [Bacillus cereus]
MESKWDYELLENVCERVNVGFVGSCHKFYTDKSGIKMIRTTNLGDFEIDETDLKYVTKVFHEKNKKSQVKKNDLLVARHGDNGKAVLYRSNEVANCLNVVIITPKVECILPDFLELLFHSDFVKNQIKQAVVGSVQNVVNTKTIAKLKIPFLSIREQRNILNIIKNLNDKIVNNKSIIKNLEVFSQILFKRWFIDFEFPNEQGQPYKSSGGEMVESELGEIPKGWTVITIKDVCDANKGSLSKNDNWSYINYLDTSNITNNSIENIQFIDATKDKIPSRAKRKIQPNDIVYSTVRPNQHHYGIIKEPTENMIASTGFTVLRSKGMYPSDLIYLWLTQREVTDNLQAIAEQSTSAYPSIKADDILSMKILLPSKKELAVLAEKIEAQNKVIWNNQQENKKLSELRDTLLPKLLSGEIEIPDELVVD